MKKLLGDAGIRTYTPIVDSKSWNLKLQAWPNLAEPANLAEPDQRFPTSPHRGWLIQTVKLL